MELIHQSGNRVTRPFDWGIDFLGYDWLEGVPGVACPNQPNGSDDPRQVVFDFNRLAVSESPAFFGVRKTPEFSLDGESLTFSSLVQTPYPENNTVYARYFPAATTMARTGLRRGRAVVVLPHWNASPAEHTALCRLLCRFGISALRLSLPYHDRRRLKGIDRADYMVSPNIGRTLQATRQAVIDTRCAIDWLKAQGYARVGIVGTSIGSCVGFLTFMHDERVDAGVFNHVSSYFGDVVWGGATTAHVRKGLETDMTRDDVRRAWLAISPNSYVHRLAGTERRGLMISARYDLSFSFKLSKLLFAACERSGTNLDRRVLPCGHYTLGRSPFKYYVGYLIAAFLRKHL
jgi:hypothetical protein